MFFFLNNSYSGNIFVSLRFCLYKMMFFKNWFIRCRNLRLLTQQALSSVV